MEMQIDAVACGFDAKRETVADDDRVTLVVLDRIANGLRAGREIGQNSTALDLKVAAAVQTEMRVATLLGAVVEDGREWLLR